MVAASDPTVVTPSPAAPPAGGGRVLPYADPWLGDTPHEYRARAYPGDHGGTWVSDDGNVLRLQTPPRRPWTLIVAVMLPLLFFFVVSGTAIEVYRSGWPRELTWPNWGWLIFGCIGATVFGAAAWHELRRPRVTWIEVDRGARVIRVPREKVELPYDRVVRLQALRIMGLKTFSSTRHAGDELQLVWNERGREMTSCVVANTRGRHVRRFAAVFQAETGVPVVLAVMGLDGIVKVTPFDGGDGRT